VLDAPAASHAKNRKHTSIVTTGSPDSPGIPARNGFNGLPRDLPGDRALLSPSSADTSRRLDASVEASEPHDFAVRSGAVRQQHVSVHRIPPRVRDDRDRPSMGRDGGACKSDLGPTGTEMFLQTGLDRPNHVDPVQQNGFLGNFVAPSRIGMPAYLANRYAPPFSIERWNAGRACIRDNQALRLG
jgi:hypothetical protein